MNFGTNQTEDETGIELTPLIDVVFLLLIFFMISTTFSKESALRINLPQADGAEATTQPRMLEVHIGANSQYAIATASDGVARGLVNSERATLQRALSKFADNPDLLLVIRADRLASHESVIKVLDVAQELNLTNITFATKRATN